VDYYEFFSRIFLLCSAEDLGSEMVIKSCILLQFLMGERELHGKCSVFFRFR